MGELFLGRLDGKIDKKGRVSIPASLRRVLVDGDPKCAEGANARLYVLHRPNKPYLEVYSVQGLEEIAERIRQSYPPASPKREALSRLFLAGSVALQLDETGRVVISEALRSKVNIGENIVFAGSSGMFEIWDAQALEADDAEKFALLEAEGLLDAPFGEEN